MWIVVAQFPKGTVWSLGFSWLDKSSNYEGNSLVRHGRLVHNDNNDGIGRGHLIPTGATTIWISGLTFWKSLLLSFSFENLLLDA
jgi:hypothetical protein